MSSGPLEKIGSLSERGAGLAVVLVALSAYVVAAFNGFAEDDIHQILANPWIKDFKHIKDILFSSVWAFEETGRASNYYRPLQHLTYMTEYRLFGLAPLPWHAVNILLHAANAFLVFSVARALSDKPPAGPVAMTAPLVAGVVFALHPINTEAVAWVACVPELAYTMLVLTALYWRLNNAGPWPLAGLFFAALLFKETAVILLPLVVICDHVVSRPAWKKRMAAYLPLMAMFAVYLALRFYALGGAAPKERMHPYLSGFQYLLNAFPLLFGYMKALAWPVDPSSFHVLRPVYSPSEPRFLVSMAALAMVFFACYRLVKKHPLHAIPLAVMMLPLIPVLYIPMLDRNSFAERYLYMPSAGFSMLAGFLLNGLLLRMEKSKILIWSASLFFAAVILSCWAATMKRTLEWRDDFTLWSATVKRQPDNYFLLKKLASAYHQKGMKEEALSLLSRSIDANLKLRDPDPRVLVLSLMEAGDIHAEAGDYAKALAQYGKVLRIAPLRTDIHLRMGRAYAGMGLRDEALSSYKEALRYAETIDEKKDVEDRTRALGAANKRPRE